MEPNTSASAARFVVVYALLDLTKPTEFEVRRVALYAFAQTNERAEELSRECCKAMHGQHGLTCLPKIMIRGKGIDRAVESLRKGVEKHREFLARRSI